MQTRTLGATRLPVTPLGLGLAAVGRPAYINLHRDRDLGADRAVESLRVRAFEVLDAAYQAGVRYVDAARSYGLAEDFLASWLDERGLTPDEVTVGSKWGYTYTAGWRLDAEVNEVKDHSLAVLRRQHAESRSILGARLRLYQVHSATLDSGIFEDREVLAELARLRAEDGLVIGVTVSGPGQAASIRRALGVEVDGVNPFATVQATWNLLEPSAGAALEEAHGAGFGVILKEVLANGRLTSPGADVPPQLRDLARQIGAGVDELAIALAAANPWADVVLSGGVTAAQVRQNAAALQLRVTSNHDATLRSLAQPPDRYWTERQRLPWR
ncbi:MAG: aldo/keto reductase [Candidatus Dormibacteraeota bacterium]|nr:aldo/keto reductase [Candidatus Dormibacteraeota bacterium]